MRVFENGIRIHAGGGINELSDATAEWNETEIKMNSVLNYI
jgi:isochorismate synthase EntC